MTHTSQTAYDRSQHNFVFDSRVATLSPHVATSPSHGPTSSPAHPALYLVPRSLLSSPNPAYGMKSIASPSDPLAPGQSSYTLSIVQRARHSPSTSSPADIDTGLVAVDAHTLCKTGYGLESHRPRAAYTGKEAGLKRLAR
ncbi:hypothetical protein V498_10510 [Pseudogymnoascus sp. VKM F-4517 (FW-2822)]|nr:hypothetical protein V498_10510 [Pseudogymnoascus sp. VKM F-4517 (FW-2822)]